MLGKGLESLIPPKKTSVPQPDAVLPEVSAPSPAPVTARHEPVPPSGREPFVPEMRSRPQRKGGDGHAIFQIEVEKIKPNQFQPRRHFDEIAIRELAASIRDFGFLQPLVVSKIQKEMPEGIHVEYELIAGERRLLAAKLLGLERVPAIVREVDVDRERLEMAIIENLQRENLNPIEMARAFARLQDEFRLTQREIAARLGKSREVVANAVRLLDLAPAIQQALEKNLISETHGRLLLAVADPAAQDRLFRDLLEKRLTTRELKERVQQKSEKRDEGAREALSPEVQSFQEKLSSRLGAPVKILQSGETGKITISFYSKEELQNLIGRLAEEEEF